MGSPGRTQTAALVFIALTWLSMALRFYVNAIIVRRVNLDDWAMLATSLVFTGYLAVLYKTVAVTAETFQPVIDFNSFPLCIRLLFATSNLFLASTILLKIAFTVFLQRFIVVKWQRKTLWISLSIFLIFGITEWVLNLVSCGNPLQYYEHRLADKCFDKNTITIPSTYVYSVFNALSDCAFAIVAFFWARGANFTKNEQKLVMGLLLLGVASAGGSFVPLYFIHLLKQPFVSIVHTLYDLGILSALKIGSGIVATSLECLEPLVFAPAEEPKNEMAQSRRDVENRGTMSDAETLVMSFGSVDEKYMVAEKHPHRLTRWTQFIEPEWAPPVPPKHMDDRRSRRMSRWSTFLETSLPIPDLPHEVYERRQQRQSRHWAQPVTPTRPTFAQNAHTPFAPSPLRPPAAAQASRRQEWSRPTTPTSMRALPQARHWSRPISRAVPAVPVVPHFPVTFMNQPRPGFF